jgi:LysR family transcriptional regulator, carnitine catabolism transcriptional activator
MSKDPFPDLSSRQLQAVLAVAEYRSFVAAASSLRMSQPALTRTIKRVEGELGVPLFTRNTRHVSVTEAGMQFASHAERLLNELRISVVNIREVAKVPQGQIIVTSVFSLANAVLPSLIAGYSREFPGVQIHLREGLHNAVRDDVRSGLADFGIGYIDDAPSIFVTERLASETLHVVMPIDSPLARHRAIELRTLANLTLVSFPPESRTRRTIDNAASAAGLTLRYLMTANRLPTLFGLVRNGVGLAVVPTSERPAAESKLTSRPIVGQRMMSRIGILRLRERELAPAAVEFLSVVRQWLLTFARDRSGGVRNSGRFRTLSVSGTRSRPG